MSTSMSKPTELIRQRKLSSHAPNLVASVRVNVNAIECLRLEDISVIEARTGWNPFRSFWKNDSAAQIIAPECEKSFLAHARKAVKWGQPCCCFIRLLPARARQIDSTPKKCLVELCPRGAMTGNLQIRAWHSPPGSRWKAMGKKAVRGAGFLALAAGLFVITYTIAVLSNAPPGAAFSGSVLVALLPLAKLNNELWVDIFRHRSFDDVAEQFDHPDDESDAHQN